MPQGNKPLSHTIVKVLLPSHQPTDWLDKRLFFPCFEFKSISRRLLSIKPCRSWPPGLIISRFTSSNYLTSRLTDGHVGIPGPAPKLIGALSVTPRKPRKIYKTTRRWHRTAQQNTKCPKDLTHSMPINMVWFSYCSFIFGIPERVLLHNKYGKLRIMCVFAKIYY